jgi:hypothetical protein
MYSTERGFCGAPLHHNTIVPLYFTVAPQIKRRNDIPVENHDHRTPRLEKSVPAASMTAQVASQSSTALFGDGLPWPPLTTDSSACWSLSPSLVLDSEPPKPLKNSPGC